MVHIGYNPLSCFFIYVYVYHSPLCKVEIHPKSPTVQNLARTTLTSPRIEGSWEPPQFSRGNFTASLYCRLLTHQERAFYPRPLGLSTKHKLDKGMGQPWRALMSLMDQGDI